MPLERLRAALSSVPSPSKGKLPSIPSFEQAVERFCRARAFGGFGPDEAVLLRQAIRWYGKEALLLVPPKNEHGDFRELLSQAGVAWREDGWAEARPFAPGWLKGPKGCDEAPCFRGCEEAVPGEPFLPPQYRGWKSWAQKEVAMAALGIPPGGTLLAVLPTGSGKSLCFQLLPRFSSGLTLVIVPTIALALDQHRAAAEAFADRPDMSLCSYEAGAGGEAALERVKDGRAHLLFAAPESAVAGKLRRPLDRMADLGLLSHLIIDEAHVAHSWGVNFRPAFQTLAAARADWLRRSNGTMRTLLLSATMPQATRAHLKAMFATGGTAAESIHQRLRPEPGLWLEKMASRGAQRAAVREAAWSLPRPAIIYTTEVAEAEALHAAFQAEGFKRLGLFTGKTADVERREVLRGWKEDEIDLVIATSAFGLGVDKADVRTIIHACLPENLDRYYQEIGRSGRDGWSSACLLLWTDDDLRVAQGLAPRLMTPKLAQERWGSMIGAATRKGDYEFLLPTDVRRLGLIGEMTYEQNIKWNHRLLSQLQRAGLIELLNISLAEGPEGQPSEEQVEVRIKFQPHDPQLGEKIEEVRRREQSEFDEGLRALQEMIAGSACARRKFAALYDVGEGQSVCGGCPHCRSRSRPAGECPPIEVPLAPARPGGIDIVAPGASLGASGLERSETIAGMVYRCIFEKSYRQIFIASLESCGPPACINDSAVRSFIAAAQSRLKAGWDWPYRIDCSCRLPFVTGSGELRLMLHLKPPANPMARERMERAIEGWGRCAHLLCFNPASYPDSDGRPFGERVSGAKHWRAWEQWFDAA